MHNDNVVLFDGVCNLCNGIVKFLIARDKKAIFKYASLQSVAGQQLLKIYKLPLHNFGTFIFIDNDKAYQKSTAALRVVKKLGGLWKIFYVLIVLPAFFRDWLYSIVANNRYRLFGKKQDCMVPTSELKSRFL